MWTPKLRPVPQQCVSCPFLFGNDLEFVVVVNRLRVAQGMPPVQGEAIIPSSWYARQQIKKDLEHSGDFACHHTVYDDRGRLKDPDGHRQCSGATKWFKEQKNIR